MKIVTWNVNSIKARLVHCLDFLRDFSPDILLLQELKCQDEAFPLEEIESLGYNCAYLGQKTYNGVAILSKHPIDEVIHGLPTFTEDEQARYIEAVISHKDKALRVVSVYVPNGNEVGSEKFAYKKQFLSKLHEHLESCLAYHEILVVGGDYNIAPAATDVFAPKEMDGKICYHPEERAAWRKLLNLGFIDSYRSLHPDTQHFSWWDYRGGSWQQNKGMRIDHLLLSPEAADINCAAGIDITPREKEKPSDHTPVWCELTL